MKLCSSCNHENRDGSNFCDHCGAALAATCPSCGYENAPSANFCNNCGQKLTNAETPVPMKAAPVASPSSANVGTANVPATSVRTPRKPFSLNAFCASKLFKIVRASVLLALATVMFILSFFSTTTVKGEDAKSLGDAMLSVTETANVDVDEIEIDITAVDYIEAAFYRLNPQSETKLLNEFSKLLQKRAAHIPSSELNEADEITEFVCDVLEEFNVLKLLSTKESVKTTPSATLHLWITVGFILIEMGLSVALFVFALLSLLKAVQGKEAGDKSLFRLNALAAVVLLFLCGFSKIFGASAGGAVIASLVLSLTALAILFFERIALRQVTFDNKHLFRYIAAATGVVFGILSLSLICGGLLNADFEYGNFLTTGSYYSTNVNYGSGSLVEAWDMFRASKNDPLMYGSIKILFQQAVSSDTVELYMNPAYMGVLGNLVIEDKISLLGILIYCASTACALTSAFALVNKYTAFMKDKKTNLLLDILILVFTVAVLVLSAIMSSSVKKATSQIEPYEYTVSLTAGIILAVIFATLQVAARITFGILDNKKNKATAE